MSGFDIVILPILGFFAWLGFRNGLVREILSIIGVVLALFIGFQYAEPATTWFNTESVTQSKYLPYFTFIVIFFVVMIFIRLTIFFMEEFLSVVMLSLPNRVMGGIFGVLKACLYLSIALIILDTVEVPDDDVRESSFTYDALMEVGPHAYNVVAFFYPGADNYYDGIKQKFEDFNVRPSNL
jgi:membrane protein required for colicin V production